MITYQFKLKPTKVQAREIDKQLSAHRDLYNSCLEIKINSYQQTGYSPSSFDLIKSETPKFKGLSNYSSLQQTVRRLDKSFKAFFKNNSSFPRFKSENRFRTIEYSTYGDGCKFNYNTVYFQFIGHVKCINHRAVEHTIKKISLSKRDDGYYVNIICETYKPNNFGESAIGIDFGVKHTITTSNGISVKNPYFSKTKHKTISRLSRRKNYKALGKVHRKIANQRKDFNHKLANSILKDNHIICMEDLKVGEITSNFSQINSKVFTTGINQLINFIKYKAENAGKIIVMVNPAYTTQTCYDCGSLNKLKLTQRIYSCKCGYQENRDINAAKNILRLGLKSLG